MDHWMILRRTWVIGAAIGGLAAGGLVSANSATANDAAGQVRAILDAGWGRQANALDEARQRYHAATAARRADAGYAMVLVLMRHRRHAEARELTKTLLDDAPGDIRLLKARAWLGVLARERAAALVEMESLARHLPADELPSDEEIPYREAAQFLGRMFGFLEGPGEGTVDRNRLRDARDRVMAPLTTFRMEAFERGYHEVLRQFAELKQEHEATQLDVREQREVQRERELERLAQERENVSGEKLSVEEQAARAQTAAQLAVNQIEQELAPVMQSLNQLNGQANLIRSQVVALDIELRRVLDLASQTEDPAQYAFYVAEGERLRLHLNRVARDLRQLDLEINQVNNQRLALEQRRQQVVIAYEGEMRRLGVKAGQLQRTAQRIAQEQRTAEKPVTGTSTRTRVMATKATSLTTYYDFPLESEKARLLETLR